MIVAKYSGVAVLVAILLAEPALSEQADTVQAAGKDANWLVIQTAQSAKFDGTTLTLSGVNPSSIIFTDRPARAAESMQTSTFVASWDKGGAKSFKSDPPNAALTSIVDGKLQTATVELSEPRLDGTTLTFKIRVIEGAVPPAGGTTSLFIDDVCLTCTIGTHRQ